MTESCTTRATPEPPAGFTPYVAASAFLVTLAPLYSRVGPDGTTTLGLWLGPQHINHQQAAHGGVLATLADNALGFNVARALGQPIATAHLSIDYLNRASAGEWLEIASRVVKRGRRMAFADCTGTVGERMIFRANGIFSVINA